MDHWLLLQDGIYLYAGIVALLIGGAVGLPIPEDIPLILGGVLIHQQRAAPQILFPVAYLTILCGDLLIYGVGYKFGFSLFRSKFVSKRISPESITSINKRLDKHAISMIFIARHLFYLRTATLLACGAFRMKFLRFLAIDAFAAAVSTASMITVGALAADYLPQLFEFIHKIRNLSLILGIICLALVIGLYVVRNKRRSAEKAQRVDSPFVAEAEESFTEASEPEKEVQLGRK